MPLLSCSPRVSTRLKGVKLLRSLTWAILICSEDADLTRTEISWGHKWPTKARRICFPARPFRRCRLVYTRHVSHLGGRALKVTAQLMHMTSWLPCMPCDDSVPQIDIVSSWNWRVFWSWLLVSDFERTFDLGRWNS